MAYGLYAVKLQSDRTGYMSLIIALGITVHGK